MSLMAQWLGPNRTSYTLTHSIRLEKQVEVSGEIVN